MQEQRNGLFKKAGYDSKQYNYEDDFVFSSDYSKQYKKQQSEQCQKQPSVRQETREEPPQTSSSKELTLMSGIELSEIGKDQQMYDPDLHDIEEFGQFQDRPCTTQILVRAQLKDLQKVRILKIGIKALCCGKFYHLRRNRQTNQFELELPQLTNKKPKRNKVCFDCSGFEFVTGKYQLQGKERVVGLCNLHPERFVVSSIHLLAFCKGEWLHKSQCMIWKVQAKLATKLCARCYDLHSVQLTVRHKQVENAPEKDISSMSIATVSMQPTQQLSAKVD